MKKKKGWKSSLPLRLRMVCTGNQTDFTENEEKGKEGKESTSEAKKETSNSSDSQKSSEKKKAETLEKKEPKQAETTEKKEETSEKMKAEEPSEKKKTAEESPDGSASEAVSSLFPSFHCAVCDRSFASAKQLAIHNRSTQCAPAAALTSRHKRRALRAAAPPPEKKEAVAKKETKWGRAAPLTRRSQKKRDELREEIDAISGIAEAKLLYGTAEWADFRLHETLARNLAQIHCSRPTVIQEKAIEAAFRGKDVLGAAPTGSGKTLAFLVPVIDWLLKRPAEEESEKGAWNIRCIIISPTRELSLQISRVIARLTEGTNIR